MKFKVGDRVRVNCPTSLGGHHGKTCTITGVSCTPRKTPAGIEPPKQRYVVDLPPSPGLIHVAYEPHEMILLYDGHELVAWKDCVWQPKQITA